MAFKISSGVARYLDANLPASRAGVQTLHFDVVFRDGAWASGTVLIFAAPIYLVTMDQKHAAG
jgi:hypothetical protein